MSEITALELKLRRDFDERREEHMQMQVELSQSTYLLKRIAGWTSFPLHDNVLRPEVARFLKSWDHEPTDLAQKPLDIGL